MKHSAIKVLVAMGVVATMSALGAQQPPPNPKDPRIGLKGGWRDAGEAAWNMELVANLPKPEGFFDPAAPAGAVSPPEPPPGTPQPTPAPRPPDAPPPPPPVGSGFTNSDLAFQGTHAIVGNYHGFNFYDVERADRPRLLASIVCPGGQGDVSVYGNLLVMSVEQTRGRLDCGTQGVTATVSAERFRGVRIFDVSDIRNPRQVAAVQTCRGSHTHTLVGPSADRQFLYLYVSGTGPVRATEELGDCSAGDPKENPNTALFSIDVIEVPLAAPEKATIVNRPRIFMDMVSGNIAGLWGGGDHGPGTQRTSATNQCHDITVYPEIGLAGGACSGNGLLMDISDPKNPKRLDFVSDKNFAYWHSATFNNDGTKLLFTDEWGGGSRPRCRPQDPLTWGADAIFDIVSTKDGKKLEFKGYFKMPAAQTEQENCVAHNGSLIPVPGRDIMVQAWYQGGLSVFDFTDSARPVEIAFFDRGPINPEALVSGGYWSTYWFNGHVYGTEISRGLDVFRLKPSEFLTQNEIDAATLVRQTEVNTQRQTKIEWPAASVVAKAYLDQLDRNKAVTAARSRDARQALDRVDELRTGQEPGARAALDALDRLASQFAADARRASGRDAQRLTALAETMRARAARLR
jgi:hypothetical protein